MTRMARTLLFACVDERADRTCADCGQAVRVSVFLAAMVRAAPQQELRANRRLRDELDEAN
jgi:hypothetical protein